MTNRQSNTVFIQKLANAHAALLFFRNSFRYIRVRDLFICIFIEYKSSPLYLKLTAVHLQYAYVQDVPEVAHHL